MNYCFGSYNCIRAAIKKYSKFSGLNQHKCTILEICSSEAHPGIPELKLRYQQGCVPSESSGGVLSLPLPACKGAHIHQLSPSLYPQSQRRQIKSLPTVWHDLLSHAPPTFQAACVAVGPPDNPAASPYFNSATLNFTATITPRCHI